MTEIKDYIVFDIESTGLLFEAWDEPIEVCAIKYIDDKEVVTFHEYIKPFRPVSKKITEITKITNDVLNNKPNKYKVLPALRRFIGDLPVVGHNSAFDAVMLNFWFIQLGLPLITKRICTMKTYRANFPKKKYNLSAATNYFGIIINQAHSAIEDTKATAKLFQVMKDLYDSHYLEMTDKEAFVEVMKRVAKANAHKKMKELVCKTYELSRSENKDINNGNEATDIDIISQLNNGETPIEIYRNSDKTYEEILDVFYCWLNNLNMGRYSEEISNNSFMKFTKYAISLCDTIDEVYDLHSLIYFNEDEGMAGINHIHYIVAFKSIKGINSYTCEDFEYYFKRGYEFSKIADSAKLDISVIYDMFSDWAIKNKKNADAKTTIKYYLTKKEKLIELLENNSVGKTDEEIITLKLYNKGFFDFVYKTEKIAI